MNTLPEALATAAIELSDSQIDRIEKYCALLWDTNQHLNLTRHTTFELFVNRDLIDTVQLSKLLQPNEVVLDIGSGGGVPAIPLAIIRPDLQITLCESVKKKATVLEEFCCRLELECRVINARVEDSLEDERYDTVTARGVGSLSKQFRWLEPHWLSVRRLLAIKGPKWREERLEAEGQRLMKHLVLRIADRYPVPGAGWESVILEIKRAG